MSSQSKVPYYIQLYVTAEEDTVCEQCGCTSNGDNLYMTEHEFESESIEVEYIQCVECLNKYFGIIPGEGTKVVRVSTSTLLASMWEVFMIDEAILDMEWN